MTKYGSNNDVRLAQLFNRDFVGLDFGSRAIVVFVRFSFVVLIPSAGGINAVVIVGVHFIILHTGRIISYNRYTKLTNNGRLHNNNVRFAAKPTAHQFRDDVRRVATAMGARSTRVLDAATYSATTRVINSTLGSHAAVATNGRQARAVYRHISARNRQRWLSSLVNAVGRHVVLSADPLICIGDYRSSSTRKGQRGGGVPYGAMVDVLSRNWVCLNVPEPYSSRNAPTTGAPVRLAAAADLDGHAPRARNRVFIVDGSRAADGRHPLRLDRDVSASLNMVQLGVNQLARDRRPAAFTAAGNAAAGGAAAGAAAGAAPLRRSIRARQQSH